MLASLLRPKRGRRRSEQRPLLFGAFGNGPPQREETGSSAEESDFFDQDNEDGGLAGRDEDEEEAPVLPIFSAPLLDKIPTYHLQHSIRILILQKCETTLSWDQLRSPQISQFLVKPIQQQIRSSHFSRGTLYALLANCLQFQKDGQMSPGSVGVFRTRALICELLAMRILKESSTRELIDALFYDFDPLQGMSPPQTGITTPRIRAVARISCVEIAIRAQAKRFLAHPLVVQQLEAIWAGTIVFHSAADYLHRHPLKQVRQQRTSYGTVDSPESSRTVTYLQKQLPKGQPVQLDPLPIVRRSVSLYDPSDASLFKLSRLRVPRYRQLFSTISYAAMLGLFLAVLIQRSLEITALEIIFWFWSAGYMLDEVVGFTEQGFGLYIMSVWNAFDIGILLMFMVYYVLRLYGILMPDARKRHTADMAYDVLASTAVLLFPRMFSILDHYRYFSQLLIAFRMMALDLAAILILIAIACSGFFVAFTLAFPVDLSASRAAYALFQILMGFTPAAWEIWDGYNLLGKAVLVMFLIICHFLIVTILITVLTNSFMAIVQNANEEHQFLFAVNTISMVKSDALFSYVPPTNVFGWLLSPLRYLMPFRQFVKLNRTVIKVTHLPILFSICAYERLILSRRSYEPMDLVEQRGRQPARLPAFTLRGANDLFSPGARLREPSVTTFHKDRALEEVFRRPFRGDTRDRGREDSMVQRERTTNVVHDWMRGVGHHGGSGSPIEEPQDELDRRETKRPGMKRFKTSQSLFQGRKDSFTIAPSALSDPEDSHVLPSRQRRIMQDDSEPNLSMEDLPQQTDQDGDDELATNDDDDHHTFERSFDESSEQEDSDKENRPTSHANDEEEGDDFRTPTTAKARTPLFHTAATRRVESPENASPRQRGSPPKPKRQAMHSRNISSATIRYSPIQRPQDKASESPSPCSISLPKRSGVSTAHNSTGNRSGTTTPRRRSIGKRSQLLGGLTPLTPLVPNPATSARPRPIYPPKTALKSVPNLAGFLALDRRKPSFNAMALDLASDLGDNRVVADGNLLAASLGTQMEIAARQHWPHRGREKGSGDGDTTRRLNKLMLARMSTLELGFQEVLREVRGLSRGASEAGGKSVGNSSVDEEIAAKRKGNEKAKRPKSDTEGGVDVVAPSTGYRALLKEDFDGSAAGRSSV